MSVAKAGSDATEVAPVCAAARSAAGCAAPCTGLDLEKNQLNIDMLNPSNTKVIFSQA